MLVSELENKVDIDRNKLGNNLNSILHIFNQINFAIIDLNIISSKDDSNLGALVELF